MATAAVAFLVEQVKEIMDGYADLISGAETEFNQLINELNILKAVLMDVAVKKKKNEHIFKELERQIREVVYEVEDSIDTSLAKAKSKTKGHTIRKIFGTKTWSLEEDVKSIREDKLTPKIAKAKKDFNMVASVDDEPGAVEDARTRTTFKRDTTIRRSKIIGFEDEEGRITQYLLEKTEKLDVIPIIGIAGLGKTTLARKIYEKDDICHHFPVRIWINISQNFNISDVFLQILRNFSSSQSMFSNLSKEELAEAVCQCLVKEKTLLVLDGVWSVNVWNEINKGLPLNNGVTKILITSRVMDVGDCCGGEREAHKLQPLTKEDSWRLLQYEVFGNEKDCPEEVRDIGEQIAMACDGLPLTIAVVGGILVEKLERSKSTGTTAKEWKMVLENVTDSIQGHEAAQRISNVVELSYNTLPDDLRDCFVYLGVFPEDYEIPGTILSGLWISEGLIEPMGALSLEDSAEEKRNDLVVRNLLMVDKTDHMGEPKTFRVPKIIRVFCIAKSMEDNLFQEVRLQTGVFKPSASEVQNIRRLCFRSNITEFLSTKPNGPGLRSFLCFHGIPVALETEFDTVLPDSFPRLRILESKSIKLHKFPANLIKLIHLRYLTIYIETLQVLPEALTQLWNLLSLVVETKSHTITMKANMWRMVRLRYLKTKAAIVLDDKKWEGKAGNLHTLNTLSAESCTEAVSSKATNLRTLGIAGKLDDLLKSEFLAKLRRLEKLKLVNSSNEELRCLPQSNIFPQNLRKLTLNKTRLDWQNLSTLAMIKSLESLKLKNNAFVGVSWKATGYNFPSLKLLLIVSTDLVLWNVSADTFPSLKFLVVKNCENLLEIPECVGANLEKLEIDGLRSSAVESAKRIRETKNTKTEGKSAVQFDLKIGPAN